MGMFADASGEFQAVEPARDGRKRAQVERGAIYEKFDHLPSTWIAA